MHIRENNFKYLLAQDVNTVIQFANDNTDNNIDYLKLVKKPTLKVLRFYDSYYYSDCHFKKILDNNKDAEYTYYYISALSEFTADAHVYEHSKDEKIQAAKKYLSKIPEDWNNELSPKVAELKKTLK